MAYYLKGIGDRLTGKNEILPQLDARMINFLVGVQHGIISGELNTFGYTTIDRGIRIRSGLLQAYGYFAMSDTDVQFNFTMPSAQTQYVQIYAEIDLSKVPQVFEIKVTALSSSNSFSPQQDNLRTNPSGKYQFWLHTAILYTNNTIGVTDRRSYITKPLNAVNADYAVTQAQTDNSTRVATTSYVRQAVSDAFNISEADLKTSAGTVIGKVRRQGNFVICYGDAYNKGDATIPEGFRPKTSMTIGVSGAWYALSLYPNNQVSGGATGYVQSDGTIRITLQSYVSQYLAVVYAAAMFYGGWEIT